MNTSTSKWLHYHRYKPGARLKLFCFPYAGGGASLFNDWPNLFPPEIEICPIQLPGRENRFSEPPLSQLQALIEVLVEVLASHLDLPYALFGHSMGALIGFGLARALRQQHLPSPTRLFVSGMQAPQCEQADIPVHSLSEAQFMEKIRHLAGNSEEILQQADILQLFLPLLRADFTLCDTYTYQEEAPLDCPISAFGGLSDKEVSRASLVAWGEQTSHSFTLRFFEGNHFFLRSAQTALVETISHELLSTAL